MPRLLPDRRIRTAAALALLAAAAPLAAQPAGSYQGTTSQGRPITVVIGRTFDGVPTFDQVIITYDMRCRGTHTDSVTAFNIYQRTPLNRGTGFRRRMYLGSSYGEIAARFDGVDTFEGLTGMTTARLMPGDPPPAAQNCSAQDVSFTVTLVPPPAH